MGVAICRLVMQRNFFGCVFVLLRGKAKRYKRSDRKINLKNKNIAKMLSTLPLGTMK
jgi:hypothetical protein